MGEKTRALFFKIRIHNRLHDNPTKTESRFCLDEGTFSVLKHNYSDSPTKTESRFSPDDTF